MSTNNENLLTVIEERYSKYSKGQKKIADFILNQYDKAAFMTASKLGKEVGVSESTVVRFSNVLGYEGYPELQAALGEIVKTRLTSLQRIEIAHDKMANEDILSKVINSDISKMRSTLENVDKQAFDRAVEKILGAKKLYILGVRSASAISGFIGFYFNLLFKDVRLVNTSSESEMFEQILRVGEGDVVIGVSFPRYSRRTIKVLEFAKRKGATVIGITDTQQSPIAERADISLFAKTDMVSFVDSLVAPLSLVNALIVAIGVRKKAEITNTLDELEHIWAEYNVYNQENE
ncbi:MAG: MurR/RpiR family transcriptional regulator [Clostridia bacterium]|nr:MurR/RpiR family transcriptional regulator [Clostridia bacterium]